LSCELLPSAVVPDEVGGVVTSGVWVTLLLPVAAEVAMVMDGEVDESISAVSG